ncbi:MAG: helix-turn-helix transcriptional regulator [Desulfuromusa sp.]|jgi:transcriptional regulator with XRE-family HTH domain|nr:helix-turn-helix transcriptional regulator [Desulfuromusa sp.]
MEPLNPPSVAIDGNSVRRIREEKRLTQFYVSKVVAVTTDTVSRWENNRYPTIMRDNALKLAAALEVDLAEILKKDDVGEISDEPHQPQTTKSHRLIYLLLLISVVFIALFYLSQQLNSPTVPVIQAKRLLPAYAAPGSRILIQAELSSEKPLKGMILKETFPPGWRLLESEPVASHIDTDAGVARWIFRQPLLETRVFYILEVPEEIDSNSDLKLVGELIANPEGQRFAAILQSLGTMQVKPFHWADSNGDHVIDDVEILELSDLTEEAKSLHLDWDLIETIWEVGAYRWNTEKKQFVPVQPLSE